MVPSDILVLGGHRDLREKQLNLSSEDVCSGIQEVEVILFRQLL